MTDTGMSGGTTTGKPTDRPMSAAQPPATQTQAAPSPGSDAKIGASAEPNAANGPLAAGPYPPALDPRLAEVAKIADPDLRRQVEANVRLQT